MTSHLSLEKYYGYHLINNKLFVFLYYYFFNEDFCAQKSRKEKKSERKLLKHPLAKALPFGAHMDTKNVRVTSINSNFSSASLMTI